MRPAALVCALTLALVGCTSGPQGTPPPSGPVESGPAVAADDGQIAELVAQADAVPTPALTWTPCDGAECATLTVPLDYAAPDGGTIEIAVQRRPADADRIGTLVIGTGGPGLAGVGPGGPDESGAIGERFDIVTFDQRGVGRSSPIRCFASTSAQTDFWSTVYQPPLPGPEEADRERASAEHARSCATNAGALLPHVSTVDVARDLDLLRRALGEERISYTGGSYASYLGAVYGALFGERLRAMQVSSIVDPAGYSTTTLDTVRERSVGTETALGEFLRQCAAGGPQRCAFAGGDITARHTALIDRLEQGPITVGRGPGAIEMRYSGLIPRHAAMLYGVGAWPPLAELLADLERGPDGDPERVRRILSGGGFSRDFLDWYVAISCADHTLPRDPGRWPELAREFTEVAPTFGRHWLYLLQPCATWAAPGDSLPQHLDGPWTVRSTTPPLLMNNRYDPVTPLSFAETARDLMGARLVVVESGGHFVGVSCADDIRERYLIDLVVPEPDTTCDPERAPF